MISCSAVRCITLFAVARQLPDGRSRRHTPRRSQGLVGCAPIPGALVTAREPWPRGSVAYRRGGNWRCLDASSRMPGFEGGSKETRTVCSGNYGRRRCFSIAPSHYTYRTQVVAWVVPQYQGGLSLRGFGQRLRTPPKRGVCSAGACVRLRMERVSGLHTEDVRSRL